MRQIFPFSFIGFLGFLFVCFLSLGVNAQIERGQFLSDEHPPELSTYFTKKGINLVAFRELTNVLTNADYRTHNGISLPQRKQAFIRHVKHLSEKLEEVYFRNWPVKTEDYELVYELILLKNAFLQQGKLDANGALAFREKIKMISSTYRSASRFSYKITENSTGNLIEEPTNSPYWHRLENGLGIDKRFKELAKEKKIKAKKKLIVLFKDFSYSGSAPKIKTLDLDLDNEWLLKWGDEVHTDIAGSHLFACLGYDVDHPYFYSEDKLTLVFDPEISTIKPAHLKDSLKEIYDFDLAPFVYAEGKITENMALEFTELAPFIGQDFLQFKKCAVEARPDRVKRIGPLDLENTYQAKRKELRGSLLAHAWIDNWDTRAANTLLTTVHDGNYNYRTSAVFSDLGTSFGVKLSPAHGDFKVGLVNEFSWEVAVKKGNRVQLTYRMNSLSLLYKSATYSDLYWMATKIAQIDEATLTDIVEKTGWPAPIGQLYFYKLASRRASILSAFGIQDPHPIHFEKNYTYSENGIQIIKNGELLVDYSPNQHPESFIHSKGRFRNYGH